MNIYGKDADSIENILNGFHLVLADCQIEDINDAFAQWLDEKPVFPTPAEIKNLVKNFEDRRLRRENPFSAVRWIQEIRDRNTDEVLAAFDWPQSAISPVMVGERFGDARTVMVRE